MLSIVLAIVAPTDELSLPCTTCLLKLQQIAARRGDIKLEVSIVPTVLQALNQYKQGDWVVVLDSMLGMPPEFVTGLFECQHDVVVGVYPLPVVDWNRVSSRVLGPETSRAGAEPLQHAGNVYNIKPKASRMQRYVPVADAAELKLLAVRSSLLQDMAGPTTSFEGGDLFAYESVFDNQFQNVYQTFARKVGLDRVVADLESPCMLSAPAQFAGCVGMRTALR